MPEEDHHMNLMMRGLRNLFIVIVVLVICIGPAFFWLPNAGAGVALPVIMMPAELLSHDFRFFGMDFTNTLTTMLLVDAIIFLIAFTLYRAYRNKSADQYVPRGFANAMEAMVEFLYKQAKGLVGDKVKWVFPVSASIFLFLLIANWVKLVPGFESVGLTVCAEYNVNAPDTDPIAPGQTAYLLNGVDHNNPTAARSFIMSLNNTGKLNWQTGDMWNVSNLKFRAGAKATRADLLECEAKYPWAIPPFAKRQEMNYVNAGIAEKETAEGKSITGEERVKLIEELEKKYHEKQIKKAEGQEGNSERFTLVPFFRGLATDLNVPLALALFAFVMVEFWGVRALGPQYFFKFVNLPAFAKGQAIDVIVGLIEIVSELSRLVSLTFRLFGAVFAGGVLLIVFNFLMVFLLPIPIYFLELVIGGMQAYVFATLTVIYASQAMVHHGGDHHDEHGHGDEHHGEAKAAH
jgi:F-type H+-transporting ATPase subunit a